MYSYYIYQKKDIQLKGYQNKPIKELQVKCESEKVPKADSAPRNRS